LARIEDDGAYANLALRTALDRSDLVDVDRRMVTDLVAGTERRRRALDHLVDRFLTSDPPPAGRRALRLGAYQLAYRDDLPDYAVVSSTVAAAPKRFRGLVNAVLRQVATTPRTFPSPGIELSYPDWVVERLTTDLGESTALDALAAMNVAPSAHRRDDGYTQDLASQWVVDAVGARSGELVVDVCAAPGGKATGMASSGATVVALDLYAQRAGLVAGNAAKLGQSLPVLAADATRLPLRPGSADRVLVDAPCSGLGVLRRRPDARWRVEPDLPERLSVLQREILDAAVTLLKPGGTLVYSVCTLTAAESTDVDAHLAGRHPRLVALDPVGEPWQPWGRGAMVLPQTAGTDGMCVFRYRLDA
jgi:16S rRNA (cytosine967-C5)-methyltransferase